MSGQHDLEVLADLVAYLMACAPAQFPYRDYLSPDAQMNLDRGYEKLRAKFAIMAEGRGQLSEFERCRRTIEESYLLYRDGEKEAGLLKLQQVLDALTDLGG